MSDSVSIDSLEMVLNEMSREDTSLKTDGKIVMNGDVLKDIEDLQEKKRLRIGESAGSMGGVDTSDIDSEIEALKVRAEEFVVTLHFSAVSNDEYLRVVARHPEAKNGWDPENTVPWAAFVTDLAEVCYTGATVKGKEYSKAQGPMKTFTSHRAVGFGQLDPIFTDVLAMNKREPDRSFL